MDYQNNRRSNYRPRRKKFNKNLQKKHPTNKFTKALEEGENAEKQTQKGLNIDNQVSADQYAQDMVFLAMIANSISSLGDKFKDIKEENQKILDVANENMKKNLEQYQDFKTQHKYLQILEIKEIQPDLKEKDKSRIQFQKNKTLYNLNQIAQQFEFKDKGGTVLKFTTANEFIDFLDTIEQDSFAAYYREPISNSEEISKIKITPVGQLLTLAEQTKGLVSDSDVSQLNLETSKLPTEETVATTTQPQPTQNMKL